jgi:ubiquinone/menaquinone biosynthesis C-methylase UbiE
MILEKLVVMLRAAGDPTRLRLLLLLRQAELTVSELTDIVGQSQPRVSRHLKLLCDAGLLERFKEGSWVFYRAADTGKGAELSQLLSTLASADADLKRLSAVREQRAAEAAAYFKANAAEWERIRALHASDKDVEAAVVRLMANARIENLLDAGTGTGRMLELLAPQAKRAVGIDVSPEMLAIARDRLMQSGLTQCQVRLGDTYRLPFPDGGTLTGFDAVLFHQVLHYLDDPGAAVAEAARVMRAGGRLLIADFAAHDLEFLRTDFAHRRLGFSDREVQGWFQAAGLKPVASEAIAPHKGSKEELTVKIWLAQALARSRAEAA